MVDLLQRRSAQQSRKSQVKIRKTKWALALYTYVHTAVMDGNMVGGVEKNGTFALKD